MANKELRNPEKKKALCARFRETRNTLFADAANDAHCGSILYMRLMSMAASQNITADFDELAQRVSVVGRLPLHPSEQQTARHPGFSFFMLHLGYIFIRYIYKMGRGREGQPKTSRPLKS